MTKPNKDGWIRHRGGKCPVGDDVRVEIRMRDGNIFDSRELTNIDWTHDGDLGDIMAYRVVSIREPASYDDEHYDCYCDCHGLIQWRDRIREIDSTTIALNEERASLVAKLKAEGFVLIQSDEPNSAAESDQQDIAQQDMSDWRNWKIGDLVTVIDNEGEEALEVGKQYKVVFLEDHYYKGICPVQLKNNDCTWLDLENMKWHSRPTN